MRALFFGSPAFAVPCLNALHEVAEIPLVITQPDRPSGRGLALKAPAVKERALELGLAVHQPTKVKTRAFRELLAEQNADVAVVVAYGRILTKRVLATPRLGCVNVHGSILPRWRGAGPIQWAIASEDKKTGVTLMQMDEGMDTGPMLALRETEISLEDTTPTLGERLAALGAELIREELPRYVAGELQPVTQPEEGVTHARLLTKADGELNFRESASALHARARAMTPWPGGFFLRAGKPVRVHGTSIAEGTGPAGSILSIDDEGLVVACGEGALRLVQLQRAGKKRSAAKAFALGQQLEIGTSLLEPAD